MSETYIPSSPYEGEKFIDREEEIQKILTLLKQSQPRVRAVVIDGDRGVGKTWLSLHLHRTIFKQEITGVTSWLFSLWSPGENYRPEGEKAQVNEYFVREGQRLKLDEFLEMIRTSLSIEWPSDYTLAEKNNSISRYIQSHLDDRFVLILDSAYESDWLLLEQLETHFLGNLLTLSNFFVVVTGRGRPYPWKVPYLIEAIRFGLGEFKIDQIKEQLRKFGLSSVLSVDDIFEISQGWPLFTEQLACAKNRTEALEIAAKILFLVVPAPVRKKIRAYFEAMSPLEGFGESEATLMVKTYEKGELLDGRTICKEMNETHLISWKNGRYVISQPVQNILRLYMQNQKKNDWIRLNYVAYRHFEKQYNEPSLKRFQTFFENRMDTHKKSLSEAGVHDLQTWSVNGLMEAK